MTQRYEDILDEEIVPENKEHAPHPIHHKQPEMPPVSGLVAVQMTPNKIFLSGFLVGVLLMGIPIAFLAARTNTILAANTNKAAGQPSAPADPSQQPPNTQPTGKPELSKNDHILGAKNADATIIVYSDLECPFCKRFHPTAKQVLQDYKGKVNLVYRHFPLSFHANARKEAEASECAASLGGDAKFYEYIDKIFERTTSNGTGFALDKLVPLAKEIGLNEGKFKTCLESGSMATRVQDDLTVGQNLGVDGTPGNILLAKNGKTALVAGAVGADELKAEIEKVLK